MTYFVVASIGILDVYSDCFDLEQEAMLAAKQKRSEGLDVVIRKTVVSRGRLTAKKLALDN